ncbi:uncharacterized protein LOC113128171 [Mastacembelus armatus]|uniref:uncharacterized protein LOC113128171 n=1 Tax=Mastacembelus armatus TaxID=205130 RepID=UPI001436908A|nr:uncharacterized protein LOC113128171 [Mastacembelus armatus]
MSADDFQTKYASVMESMLKSAVAETTKLFETMVDELKAEISRIKKENEDLKTRCLQFENSKSQPTVYTSEPLSGLSDGCEKRDTAIQCDLVTLSTMLLEKRHTLRDTSLPQQEQLCCNVPDYSFQEHNYVTPTEASSQMTLMHVKQEESYNDSSPLSDLKKEKAESPVACGQILHEKPGLNPIPCTGECRTPELKTNAPFSKGNSLVSAEAGKSAERERSDVIESLKEFRDELLLPPEMPSQLTPPPHLVEVAMDRQHD